ncbi:MAG: hypothetical protein IJ632_00990 [Muribaculaceae bacterium]|nr:hypothetical protein [Muribaculaceae bacterium]
MSSFTFNKFITGLARFLSAAMSPLLMPTYGVFLVLWTSILCLLPTGTRVTVMVMVMGITCVLPVVFISVLHHLKLISDKRLINRRERIIPYAFAVLCYVGATFYIDRVHSPMWFTMFMAGASLACLVDFVVSLWWKISAHATGISGLVALLYQLHVQGLSAFDMFWLLCFTILLAGALGTSRLILKRHTLPQVLAGFACGYVCVTLMMKLFG